MRKIVLFLIVAAGLTSFKKNSTERDAFIIKAIEERIIETGVELQDIDIRSVKRINERQYIDDGLPNTLEQLGGKGSWSARKWSKEDQKEADEKLDEILNKAGTDKGYGYKVRVKCNCKHAYGKAHNTTMTFVVSKHGDVELAYTRSFI